MSGSIHREAAKTNVSCSSVPDLGAIEKIPGCGGALVTTITAAEDGAAPDEGLHVRVNEKVAPAGRELASRSKFKLTVVDPCTETVVDIGVRDATAS